MTPSKLLKLNIKYYRYLIATLSLSIIAGLYLMQNYSVKINNTYEILIVEDINTKYLVDRVYERKEGLNNKYYQFLKNYTVSEFVNSTFNKGGNLEISAKGDYTISISFKIRDENKIDDFENNLSKFLKVIEKTINNQITKNFQFRIGKSAIDVEADSQLYFNKTSKQKGNNPITIFFVTIMIGIIIMNFIIILENPPKK
jgi:hypothetical protein